MNSALHQAACNNNDNPRIIQILFDYGCRIDETDEEVNGNIISSKQILGA